MGYRTRDDGFQIIHETQEVFTYGLRINDYPDQVDGGRYFPE